MVHRRLGGRPFIDLPALRDIARDDSSLVVIQKSAQVGLTELMVSKALWAADTAYAGRGNVMFVMPTQNQMDDFAQARVDRAIQESSYLRSRLQPEPPARKGADSKRLKRIGPGWLFMRGADSRRQIASVDADLVLLDEFDQMAGGTFELAQKRLTSSRRGQLIVASTPRLPEAGVNGLYLQSDQRRYHLTCQNCGLEQALTWEHSGDRERLAVVCLDCRAPMDVMKPGRWIAQAPGNRIRGYHLSRLYAPWVNLQQMLEASDNPGLHGTREFYNSDLGEVFAEPGGGLSLDDLDRCRREYEFGDYRGQSCVMGVDVGNDLHVVVREAPAEHIDRDTGKPPPGLYPEFWEDERPATRLKDEPARLWFVGTVRTFEELDLLVARFHVTKCVIDAQPETREAVRLAERHRGKVALARYDRREAGYERTSEAGVVMWHAERTFAIDETFERFRREMAELPSSARSLGGREREGSGEYLRELLALKRVTEQDASENWVARYRNNGRDDHYAHAEVYAWLAAHWSRLASPYI